jgi:hypothetical protein
MLGCQWDPAEKRKWEDSTARKGPVTSVQTAAPYSAEETAFVKEHYGFEFHFLLQHGLQIHDEEDREERWAILRAVMREDDMSEDASSDEPADEFNESEFEGHQADYNFTHHQLD